MLLYVVNKYVCFVRKKNVEIFKIVLIFIVYVFYIILYLLCLFDIEILFFLEMFNVYFR